MRGLSSVIALISWGLAASIAPLVALGNDNAPLCQGRRYQTEFATSTDSFYAAICSSGYVSPDSECYVSDKYFYVAQNRRTKESIVLPALRLNESSSDVFIYQGKKGKYTYQMATSGGYAMNRWTSLSVFLNGKKIYHKVMNSYYGFYDC